MKKELVFLDTEFSSLNPYKGEILSIGLVKENGDELYSELEFDGEVDDWVKENILPNLKQEKLSKIEVKKQVKKFINNTKPYLVAFVNQFDVVYLHKLLGKEDFNNTFFWISIDFASILYIKGYDPEEYFKNQKEFVKKLGINPDKYIQHNALDDAKLLRETYSKL
ncbi:exonuclease domain-containing protein [Patescibacteria group bacterium]